MSKSIKRLVGASFAAAIVAGAFAPAAASERNRSFGQPAQISWAARGGIRDWHADDDRSIYLKDRTGRWFYATLSAPCPELRFERRLGFRTGPLGEFDEWGVIHTRTYSCHVDRLVTSPAPAARGGPRLVR